MQKSKYASNYSLVKDPIQKQKTYQIFYARNKQTNLVWMAKIFHSAVLQQLSMEDHVGYNQQVFRDLTQNQKEHVVYVKEIFIKGGDTFMIQEPYQIRLNHYLAKKGTLKCNEIQRILKDTFQGACDIYEAKYFHYNLRSQHIVKVVGETDEIYTWKIDWVVLDGKEFPVDTPFTWKKETASLEDRTKTRDLDQDMMDAQIVWNFGYLAVEMLIGTKVLAQMISKQNEVSWSKIKQLTKDNPYLFQLIDSCFRYRYKERIPLKRFLDLKLFQDVARPGIQQNFMTASKIFKTSTFSSFQKSMNLKSQSNVIYKNNLKSKIISKQPAANTYFNNLEQVKEQIYDDQGQKDINRFCFLVEVSSYLNLINSPLQQSKMLENRLIIQIFLLKLATKIEQRIKPANMDRNMQNSQMQHKSKIKNHNKLLKTIRQKENPLILRFNLDLKIDYTYKDLVVICNKLCGYAYSRLREECEQNEDSTKLKAMVYFTLVPYLINVQGWRLIQQIKKDRNKDYVDLFNTGDLNQMLKLSQNILKQYFEGDQ